MRSSILILCSVAFQIQASQDWLDRTVRVNLVTTRKDFVPHYNLYERSETTMTSALSATNGQYPWSIMTVAWTTPGFISIGVTCSGTIIAQDYALSSLRCVNRNTQPPVDLIEVYFGSVQWNSTRSYTNLVRHYWYITPSSENRPNIVLFRLHESITFNPNVQPIRLPSAEKFSYDAWSSYILGFQTPGSGPFSAQLSSVQARILNNELCNFNGIAPDYEMCGSEGSDPRESGPIMRFNGFSGGAWVVHEYTTGFEHIPVLIGIHQFQFANQSASFGYATRVSHFVEWIQTLSLE